MCIRRGRFALMASAIASRLHIDQSRLMTNPRADTPARWTFVSAVPMAATWKLLGMRKAR